MNGFFEQFRTFALDMWAGEGGLVSRPESRPVPGADSKYGSRPHPKSPMGMMVAIGMAIGMCISVPATAASSPWERMQSAVELLVKCHRAIARAHPN